MNQVELNEIYLTVNQVAERYGVSKDTIWRWKREGDFPKGVKVGPNCTRWRQSEIIAHEASLQTCCMTHLAFC
ncbi:hypothetical protein CKO11_11870 [Rhodobacter sp. TJ_12]|uniref:helix-turn-helix transcriptional regulator n=1 Tax=Rhodobacter sp. TJ_12 TaxID=2029399 RepID=UPI001CBF0B1E|nr:AlpA family phage regulatory protein [Rhodobacter sp. TJ_12]MBZ4023155.1 hypothetical protein [Rhodobacter sp. TJ_12]